MTRVLVLTGARVGSRMAGPALRAWNIARVARQAGHQVVLATTGALEPGTSAPFALREIRAGDRGAYRRLEADVDVIVVQGLGMRQFPALRRTRRILVADLYAPMHLEQLEQTRGLSADHAAQEVERAVWTVDVQLAAADLILCASRRQRALYIGHLAALGRIVPSTYRDDPELARLLAVVPYGIPAEPPRHERAAIRGVVPGIEAADRIVIWSGGIWDWFDPETLVRAVGILSARRDRVRLFFQGTSAPGMPEPAAVVRARTVAAELGILDREVILQEGWVDWDDRQNYLTEADAGVSTHHPHLETEYSHRTRVLDYLWAGLPMVLTEGDSFAELVERHGLGTVVPAGDPEALADALERVLFDAEFADRCRRAIEQLRSDLVWERSLEPLVAFLADPHRAADRPRGRRPSPTAAVAALGRVPPGGTFAALDRASRALRRDGVRSVWRRLRTRGR